MTDTQSSERGEREAEIRLSVTNVGSNATVWVTPEGSIGIDVGGYVSVMPPQAWIDAAARSRQQQDAVDAARYRWLRDPKNETHPAWDELIETGQKAETFDATVDAALEGDKL